MRYTLGSSDDDAIFDTKVIYQQDYTLVEPGDVPAAFKPVKVPYGILDINQIFAAGHGRDIFADREISRDGAIIVVRPDQYVAAVLPLQAREELAEFFARHMIAPPQRAGAAQNVEQDIEIAERVQIVGSELSTEIYGSLDEGVAS